ncbi:MAG: AAA family ATPase [Lachnospiraceae bacterium]|nr:AAA family ATPase [Lachnospiraceae bacterium]
MVLTRKACDLFQERFGKSYILTGVVGLMVFYIRTMLPEEEQNDDTLMSVLNLLIPIRHKSFSRCRFSEFWKTFEPADMALKKAKENGDIKEQDFLVMYCKRPELSGEWTLTKYTCIRDFLYWYASQVGSGFETFYRMGLVRYIDTHDDGRTIAPRGGQNASWCRELGDVMQVFNTGQDELKQKTQDFLDDHTPRSIREQLDTWIIGQEDAKKLIATAVCNHYARIAHPEKKLRKFNVLMIGPSGSGKTEIVRRLREILDVPVILEDVSGLVATPYRGRNKEELLRRLVSEADGDIGLAQAGIIFCDEFDKLCHPSNVRGYDNNDQIMGQFLGMMEGAVINTAQRNGKKSDDRDYVIDTKNILFVCMGAFEGLEEIVLKDLGQKEWDSSDQSSFGMKPKTTAGRNMRSEDVELKHLVEYGMKPELAGRLCNLAVLHAVDLDLLKRIMTEAEDNPIKRIQRELALDDQIEIIFDDEAIDVLAKRAIALGTGVRALNGILREVLKDVLYQAPSLPKGTQIRVTKEMAAGADMRSDDPEENLQE